MRIDSEPAFVLHTRPYRETSQLVDVFTRHHGRFRTVAKGFRRAKAASRHLSPFAPLLVGWTGKGDLKNLINTEQTGASFMLSGDRLYSGLYLNELLLRLLAENDPHLRLFDHYLEVLQKLASDEPIEPPLRKFEFCLLDEIGYGLAVDVDATTGEPISPESWYWFDPSMGFVAGHKSSDNHHSSNWFHGAELLSLNEDQDQSAAVGRTKKRLMRLAIQSHIGDKPLRSRELFAGVDSVSSALPRVEQ